MMNVAILGSGIIVKTGHAPGILNNSDKARIAAVYARTTESAEALVAQFRLPDVSVYSEEKGDYEQLLARADIDFYIVALPINLQPPVVRQLLAAGKHVLSEKPIAENCQDARELLDFYDGLEHKPIWGVGENFRFKPSYQEALALLPAYGHLSTFHVHDQNYTGFDNVYYNTPWRTEPKHQGGFIMDGGLHNVAGLRILLPGLSVSRVAAFANQVAPHLPPVDTLNAAVVLSNGVNGTYSGAYSSGIHRKDVVIVCEKANVTVAPNVVVVRDKKDTVLFQKEWDPLAPEAHAITLEIKAFIESIERGVPDERLSPREAYLDLHMLEQMIESAREDGVPKPVQPAPFVAPLNGKLNGKVKPIVNGHSNGQAVKVNGHA